MTKYVLIFFWVSLTGNPADQPQAALTVNPEYTDITGVHREHVQYFNSAEQCREVQKHKTDEHKNDFIFVSICGKQGTVGVLGTARD